MYLFVDTEFTDFTNCDLISLGIVSEDGKHEFYIEINDHVAEWRSGFVNQVIMPLLDMQKYGKSYRVACWELKRFLEELPTNNIIFIVDYVGDWHLLNEMLKSDPCNKTIEARMLNPAFIQAAYDRGIHTPAELQQCLKVMMLTMEDYFKQDPRRHHALVDAKANRHGWVKGLQ